jgi:hypothetical protein
LAVEIALHLACNQLAHLAAPRPYRDDRGR